MIAMFQIPNKFFAKDGRVTDQHGHDWEELWGAYRLTARRIARTHLSLILRSERITQSSS